MKTRTLILAALVIAFCFSGLLIRLFAQEREIACQREKIASRKSDANQLYGRLVTAELKLVREQERNNCCRIDCPPSEGGAKREAEEAAVAQASNLYTVHYGPGFSMDAHSNSKKDLDAEIETWQGGNREK